MQPHSGPVPYTGSWCDRCLNVVIAHVSHGAVGPLLATGGCVRGGLAISLSLGAFLPDAAVGLQVAGCHVGVTRGLDTRRGDLWAARLRVGVTYPEDDAVLTAAAVTVAEETAIGVGLAATRRTGVLCRAWR